MEVSENSFPLYLSSNACPLIYPKNTASNFRTRLNKPIQLTGKWEVGLKNISYSAQIEDKTETASVELVVTCYKDLSVNKIYDYEFKTTKNRWIGFHGVRPKMFEKDIGRVLKILDTLNEMNALIIKNADKKQLFHFSTTVKDGQTYVVFRNTDPSFVLKITSRMSTVLGFNGRTQFEGLDMVIATKPPAAHAIIEKTESKLKSIAVTAASSSGNLIPPQITVEIFPRSDSATPRTKRGLVTATLETQNQTKRVLTHAGGVGVSRQDVSERQSADDTAQSASKEDGILTADDYELLYLSSNVQNRQKHIVFKPPGVDIGLLPGSIRAEEEVVNWITGLAKIEANIENDKIVINNPAKNIALEFSSDFMKSVVEIDENEKQLWKPYCPCVIFPESKLIIGTRHLKKNSHISNNWFVNVYNTNLDLTKRPVVQRMIVAVNPWLEKNVSAAMSHINQKVKEAVAGTLNVDYQPKEHSFTLSLISRTRAKLEHGENILPKFSKNLAYLFAFPEEPLRELSTIGEREVDVLENRRRQLYILSNIIPVTSYGERQHHILSDFLHKGGNSKIIDKNFRPVIYHEMNNTNLNDIHIEIVTDSFNAISMKESDTILTLHFRRAN